MDTFCLRTSIPKLLLAVDCPHKPKFKKKKKMEFTLAGIYPKGVKLLIISY